MATGGVGEAKKEETKQPPAKESEPETIKVEMTKNPAESQSEPAVPSVAPPLTKPGKKEEEKKKPELFKRAATLIKVELMNRISSPSS